MKHLAFHRQVRAGRSVVERDLIILPYTGRSRKGFRRAATPSVAAARTLAVAAR